MIVSVLDDYSAWKTAVYYGSHYRTDRSHHTLEDNVTYLIMHLLWFSSRVSISGHCHTLTALTCHISHDQSLYHFMTSQGEKIRLPERCWGVLRGKDTDEDLVTGAASCVWRIISLLPSLTSRSDLDSAALWFRSSIHSSSLVHQVTKVRNIYIYIPHYLPGDIPRVL